MHPPIRFQTKEGKKGMCPLVYKKAESITRTMFSTSREVGIPP